MRRMDADDRIQKTLGWLCAPNRTEVTYDDLRSWVEQLGASIHLAIMVEPYLTKVCSGEKYIESRLTKVKMSPYQSVFEGDIILFKRSGGSIEGIAAVGVTKYTQLSSQDDVYSLVDQYGDGLSYEPGYAESKSGARFGSLLWLQSVHRVPPVTMMKRDRQAWVTIAGPQQSRSVDYLF